MLALLLLAGLPLTFNFDPGTSEGDRHAAAVTADLSGDWLARVNPAALHSMDDWRRLDAHFGACRLHQRQAAVNRKLTVSVLRTDRYPHPAYCVGDPEHDDWHAIPRGLRCPAGYWLRFAEWVAEDARFPAKVAKWEREQRAYVTQVLADSGWSQDAENRVREWAKGQPALAQQDDYPNPVYFADGGRLAVLSVDGWGNPAVTVLTADLGLHPPAVALKSQSPTRAACPLELPAWE